MLRATGASFGTMEIAVPPHRPGEAARASRPIDHGYVVAEAVRPPRPICSRLRKGLQSRGVGIRINSNAKPSSEIRHISSLRFCDSGKLRPQAPIFSNSGRHFDEADRVAALAERFHLPGSGKRWATSSPTSRQTGESTE
jgi:hypothetical protein